SDAEEKVYELIVRHFLACCSADAKGFVTKVKLSIANEMFEVNGVEVVAKNFLEIYPYQKWSNQHIPSFTLNQEFIPSAVSMTEGATRPPPLLAENDLIDLMDKHGIGTDATMAKHIRTIQERVCFVLFYFALLLKKNRHFF
ncbi:hypothetical protein RFI_34748, partial [Reticulomyxa filosa]